jgi:hypothetical protein
MLGRRSQSFPISTLPESADILITKLGILMESKIEKICVIVGE